MSRTDRKPLSDRTHEYIDPTARAFPSSSHHAYPPLTTPAHRASGGVSGRDSDELPAPIMQTTVARPAPRIDPTRPNVAVPSRPILSQNSLFSDREIPTPALTSVMAAGRTPMNNVITDDSPVRYSIRGPLLQGSEAPDDSPLKGPASFSYNAVRSMQHHQPRQQQAPPPKPPVSPQQERITETTDTPQIPTPQANISQHFRGTPAPSTTSGPSSTTLGRNNDHIQAVASMTQAVLSRSNAYQPKILLDPTPQIAIEKSAPSYSVAQVEQTSHTSSAAFPVQPPAASTANSIAVPRAPRVGLAEITEQSMLRDMMWLFLGMDRGTHIEWYDGGNFDKSSYVFQTDCTNSHFMCMLRKWQECGRQYRQLTEILKKGAAPSLLQQSLFTALGHQLSKYREVVAEELKQPVLHQDRIARMHPELYTRLRTLFHVVSRCRDTKGGALLSKLDGFLVGSSTLRDLVEDLSVAALNPFYAMIRIWITQGDIQDPFHEFLVEHDEKVKDTSEEYWSRKYHLRQGMLPPCNVLGTRTVFTDKLVADILAIGKTINFVRMLCQRSDSCVAKALQKKVIAMPTDGDWTDLMESVLSNVNMVLHDTLTKTCHLTQHFYLLNYYVLLAKGDFVQLLFEKALPLMNTPRDALSQAKLREALTAALRETITPDIDPLLTERLNIVEISKGGGAPSNSMTEKLFYVTYNPQGVMNNIFDGNTLGHYHTLCKYLVRVKYSEYILKQAWKEGVDIDRVAGPMPPSAPLKVLTSDTHQMWLECQHFIQILQSFLVHEALGAAWGRFSAKLEGSACLSLDEIRRTHLKFLREVLEHSLLSGREELEIPRKIIDETLANIQAFCMLHQRVFNLVVKKKGDEAVIGPQLKRQAVQFRSGISRLVATLEKGALLQYDFLQSLLLSLNFNNFYKESKTESAPE